MVASVPSDGAQALSEQRRPGHYPLFDYLRILLAVGVFFRHALGDDYLSEHFGNACVQVFFALSGFLIGTILLDARTRDLPAFYFKRLVRIWIPYAIANALLMAGAAQFQDLHDPLLWRAAFYNVTFVTNVFTLPQSLWPRMPMWGSAPHFWSICVEEQFYLLAPLVMVFLPRARIALLIAVAASSFFVPHDFAAVALGVLLALAAHRAAFTPGMRAAFAFVAISSVVATFEGWVSYAGAAPVGAVALVGALTWPGKAATVGAFLGGISYPFYLNHWLPLWLRPKMESMLGVSGNGAMFMALLIALALSSVHYMLVDRPVLAARARWYTERRGRRAWTVGFALVGLGLVVGAYLESMHSARDVP